MNKTSTLRSVNIAINWATDANIVRFFGIYLAPGVTMPSFVMERLQGSLYDLLKQNPTTWPIVKNPTHIPVEIKLSILHQIGLGLRYLHSRVPPIVCGKLSSKKVLISKGVEAKIACIGTIIKTGHKTMSAE